MAKTHWHVIGAGAIGCVFAHALSTAGAPVTLLLREKASDAPFILDRDGTQITLDAARAYPSTTETISHLLVTTKAYDVLAAVSSVSHRMSDNAVVVLLINGMGLEEDIRAQYPALDIYCGTTTEGAHRVAARRVRHAGRGSTLVGKNNCERPPRWFDDWKNGIQPCAWDSNIDAALWHKLAINAVINPLTAIYRCSNGTLATHGVLRDRASALCREVCQISYAAGYTATAQSLQDAVGGVVTGTAKNRSSMLQDVEAGRATEIDYITGYLLQVAQEHGITAPENRAVYKEVTDIGR